MLWRSLLEIVIRVIHVYIQVSQQNIFLINMKILIRHWYMYISFDTYIYLIWIFKETFWAFLRQMFYFQNDLKEYSILNVIVFRNKICLWTWLYNITKRKEKNNVKRVILNKHKACYNYCFSLLTKHMFYWLLKFLNEWVLKTVHNVIIKYLSFWMPKTITVNLSLKA
jgi:hypothetical protein